MANILLKNKVTNSTNVLVITENFKNVLPKTIVFLRTILMHPGICKNNRIIGANLNMFNDNLITEQKDGSFSFTARNFYNLHY